MRTTRCGRGQVLVTSVLVLAAAALVGLGAGLAVIASTASSQVERVIVVDSDGGPDDALGILLLLAAENESVMTRTRIIAVTCVRGNTGIQNVTRNVLATLAAAGRLDVPVFAGAGVPLVPPAPDFTYYYGWDGFGDFLQPAEAAATNQSEHAALALVRLAKEYAGRSEFLVSDRELQGECKMMDTVPDIPLEYPSELTLLCIGPLTNVALATRLDSSFLDNLKEIFILGGAAHGNGNTRPGAEFNVFVDPDAATIVFETANRSFSILPWETALDSSIPIDWRLNVLGSLNTSQVQLLNQAERKILNDSTWVSADGLLAATLINDSIITSRYDSRISVLTGEGPARGVTLVDHSNTLGRAPNAVILEKPDVSSFQRLLLRMMSRGS